jgi:hypothetical protein
MGYPIPSDEKDEPAKQGDLDEPLVTRNNTPFEWSLDANGQIVAHMYAHPGLILEQSH